MEIDPKLRELKILMEVNIIKYYLIRKLETQDE